MITFAESTIEQAALDWLQELGYDYAFGSEIVAGGFSRLAGKQDEK